MVFTVLLTVLTIMVIAATTTTLVDELDEDGDLSEDSVNAGGFFYPPPPFSFFCLHLLSHIPHDLVIVFHMRAPQRYLLKPKQKNTILMIA